MSTNKERNNRVFFFLFLLGITTVIVFGYTLKQQFEASQASANHPMEVAFDQVFYSWALIAIFSFAATVIGFVWHHISVPIKSRFSILRATMLTLPALISLLACWGWMISLWCADDKTNTATIQEQLALASVVSGVIFAVLLPVVGLGSIVRRVFAKISPKLTPRAKGYCRFLLLLLGTLFSIAVMAALLFTLDHLHGLRRRSTGNVFTWWLDPSAVLFCCATPVAGVELFLGILYVFHRDRRKVPLGSLLLVSSVMKYITILGCLCEVMDISYSIYIKNIGVFGFCFSGVVLQCVVPFILYLIAALLRKKSQEA